jgi:uncharacterized membrane protein YfcA
MIVSPLLVLVTIALGALAGAIGTLLGLGGGVFLVPFLVLVVNMPFHEAAAISLMTVIATSSTVSAARAGHHLINVRLGMVLEVATAAGGLLGGLTAQMLAPRVLQLLFSGVAAAVAIVTFVRRQQSNALGPDADIGRLGGRFTDERSGEIVSYRVKRLPLALASSFVAGNVSSLLGVGGGFVKVPVLNAWCGIPMRAAAATSAFMIGVTATSGALIYYGHGALDQTLAAAAVIGVSVGSIGGMRIARRMAPVRLKILLGTVLLIVAALMLLRAQ